MGKVAVRDGFSGHGAWERKRPRPIAGFSLGVALGPVAPRGAHAWLRPQSHCFSGEGGSEQTAAVVPGLGRLPQGHPVGQEGAPHAGPVPGPQANAAF